MGLEMRFVTKSVTTNFFAHNVLKYHTVKYAFFCFLSIDTKIYICYCHQIKDNSLISLPESLSFSVVTKMVTIKSYRRHIYEQGAG